MMENRLEIAVYSRNVIKFSTQTLRRHSQAFITSRGVRVQPRVAIQGVSDEAYNPDVSEGSRCSTGSKRSDRVGHQTPTLHRHAFLLDSIQEIVVMLIRMYVTTKGMF
jgi:hypothetical protein